MASGGSQGLPMGFALEVVGRDLQTAKILNGWASRDRPSQQFLGALEEGLDLGRFGGAFRLERTPIATR